MTKEERDHKEMEREKPSTAKTIGGFIIIAIIIFAVVIAIAFASFCVNLFIP